MEGEAAGDHRCPGGRGQEAGRQLRELRKGHLLYVERTDWIETQAKEEQVAKATKQICVYGWGDETPADRRDAVERWLDQ
eukprot:10462658-Alexandrium_andersonii.AAC.1